jgi:hypothetical protein
MKKLFERLQKKLNINHKNNKVQFMDIDNCFKINNLEDITEDDIMSYNTIIEQERNRQEENSYNHDVNLDNSTNIYNSVNIVKDINIDQNNNLIDISKYRDTLEKMGYVIIPGVYNEKEIQEYWSEFNKWRLTVPDLDYLHSIIDFNGIFKHHQVGHQRFAWLARTNPKIIDIFKQLWNTDELVTSFDGCCYYPSDYIGEPRYWTHSDQSSRKKGLTCYQSFLSLTDNCERSLLLYRGSHLLHEKYFTDMNIDEPRDWNIIDENYIKDLYDRQEILEVKKGDLVIWDSRLFHQNTCGTPTCDEERLIQYLCYLPKNSEKNTVKEQLQRRKYFETLRTTSHWPYPMNVVPKQPNLYNYYIENLEDKIYINYESLPKPHIHDLVSKIEKLL